MVRPGMAEPREFHLHPRQPPREKVDEIHGKRREGRKKLDEGLLREYRNQSIRLGESGERPPLLGEYDLPEDRSRWKKVQDRLRALPGMGGKLHQPLFHDVEGLRGIPSLEDRGPLRVLPVGEETHNPLKV